MKPEDLGHDGRLESIVSENYRLISQDGRSPIAEFPQITHLVQGAVSLQTIWYVILPLKCCCRIIMRFTMDSDTSIRLTDIDDAAREAWKEDRLDDAEEILSRQSNRHTGSDHSVFANRALIRARLHHWDAALRDAEMVSFRYSHVLKVTDHIAHSRSTCSLRWLLMLRRGLRCLGRKSMSLRSQPSTLHFDSAISMIEMLCC